jgi:hypothetical protein
LLSLPIERRRELLESTFPAPEDPLRLSPLLQAPTGQVLEAVRKLGLEGVIGKRLDSTDEPGERSGAWIKQRTNLDQEFVIGGYIRCTWLRCVARRRLREDGAHIRREGEERLRPPSSGRDLPGPKALQTVQCPFKNLPEKRASRWGESL